MIRLARCGRGMTDAKVIGAVAAHGIGAIAASQSRIMITARAIKTAIPTIITPRRTVPMRLNSVTCNALHLVLGTRRQFVVAAMQAVNVHS